MTTAGYVWLPGTNGNYLSVPDSPALDVTDDIDITVGVRRNWGSHIGLSEFALIKDQGSGAGQPYAISFLGGTDPTNPFGINAGFRVGATGAQSVSVSSHSIFNDGELVYVRVTRVRATGLMTLYARRENEVLWTTLNSAVGGVGQPIYVSDGALHIGAWGGFFPLAGEMHYVSVSNGIGQLPVFALSGGDLISVDPEAASFPVSTGQTVTVHRFGDPHTLIVPLPNTSNCTYGDGYYGQGLYGLCAVGNVKSCSPRRAGSQPRTAGQPFDPACPTTDRC